MIAFFEMILMKTHLEILVCCIAIFPQETLYLSLEIL